MLILRNYLIVIFSLTLLTGCATANKQAQIPPENLVIQKPSYQIKRIVLDAGHGGKDPGAISRNGLEEKDINLDITKRLKTLFENQGFEVMLTRDSDMFVELGKRAKIANNESADLFLSVHTNSSHSRRLNGFEIYYISEDMDDTERAVTTTKHFYPKKIERDDIPYDAQIILWDLLYTQNRAVSFDIANYILKEADDTFHPKILGVKKSKFYVLNKTIMPAILIEVGFLSNREEERRLQQDIYRQRIAESIAKGVINYSAKETLAKQ